MSIFFKRYRRKGYGEALSILEPFGIWGIKKSEFYKTLKDNKSYMNSFIRVKNDLLEDNLIHYLLDEDNEIVIHLTQKGIEVTNLINKLDELIKTEN